MQKVLIAIDYNPVSEKVAKQGYELAKKLNCEVCLIHVVTDESYYEMSYSEFMGYVPVKDDIEKIKKADELHKVGIELLSSATEFLKDPNVQTHVAEGDTAQAILKYADEWQADLIVMGTHSHKSLEKIFLGTVASKIIEETNIPVHLIPVKR